MELHFSVDFQLKDTFWNEKQHIEKNCIHCLLIVYHQGCYESNKYTVVNCRA